MDILWRSKLKSRDCFKVLLTFINLPRHKIKCVLVGLHSGGTMFFIKYVAKGNHLFDGNDMPYTSTQFSCSQSKPILCLDFIPNML